MRNLVVTISAIAVVSFVGTEAFAATTLTEQQVRDVCGSKLQSGGGAMGCSKCDKGTCVDYSCGGKEGKGCRGQIVGPPPKAASGAPKVNPKVPPSGIKTTGGMKDTDASAMKNKLQTDNQIQNKTLTPTTTSGPALQKR